MIKEITEKIFEIIYPVKCPFCGEIVSSGNKKMSSRNWICAECRRKVPYLKEPRCMCCGKPVINAEQEYCFDCSKRKHAFEEGRSLWIHKEPAEQAIYAFKYHNRRIYGKAFGAELADQYGDYLKKKGITMIVPIPLHRKRKKRRGYNQAEILAKVLGESTGIMVDAGVLERVKATKPQKQLDNKGRRRNIKGAFRVTKSVKGEKIMLIDDIYTTGSTLDEAAGVLKRSGAEKVYFLTLSIGQGI